MTWRPPFTALVTSLFAVWLVAAGLIPATSPRVQAQDTGATLTFTCGTTPAPCEVQPGGTITVTGRAIRVCETFTALELVNVAGVPVTLGTLSFCTSFEPRLFTVPTSVAPGVYTVRLRLLDPPSTVLVTAVQLLTVAGSTGGSLTGTADCGSGGLEGALVELFSGASFVASTIAGRGGAFSFDVAPGQYTVRIKYRGEVCGGPAEPGGEQDFDRPLDLHNHSWPRAYPMTLVGGTTKVAAIDEHIFLQDQSTWFKFKVTPGSQVIVTLTGGTPSTPLPENYDLTLYKDIAAAFKELNSPEDLVQLQAESAPDAFAPDAFAPDAFAPDAFAPDAFAPDAFAPDAFAPDAFAPDAFAPDAFAPDAFAPDAFAPDAFAPDAFAPDAFAPDAFAPDAFAPDAFAGGEGVSPDAFAGAQTRSLIAVSAFNGTSGEGVARNTWDNNTDFYVRVRGRNGAFSLAAPFHLEVTMNTGDCEQVVPITAGGTLAPVGGGFKTLVLTDLARLAGSAAEKTTLQTRIGTFAARSEVAGRFVDFGAGDARIAAAKAQSDAHNACPFAKNLLAAEIKRLIDGYRALNPGLEYIVFIGNDDVVPFQRVPDTAGLANEKTYSPPVLDPTASQASLKLGYVLTQDNYGSRRTVSRLDHHLPLPDLAVGRLIETAADATGMLDAYLATTGGVVSTPTSGLVTGYDFLADAATAIGADLTAALGGGTVDALIQPNTSPPTDPSAWTADQLRNALLGKRHDLIFLGGHFSQGSALAADFTTRMVTTELLASNVDLVNAVIFSIGCHSGYNTVDPHAVQGVTPTPDWGQSFARKGATFIGGTGYQYGETEIIEYSERLYLEFSRALRTGSGPIPVGKALYAAKRTYLANTPVMRGIHEKALLESTLFGLPMLSVNVPGARLTPPSNGSIVPPNPPVFGTKPGSTLGLRSAQVKVTSSFNEVQVPLTNTATNTLVTPNATYLSGGNGLAVNPGEPVLPLELRNVSVPNTVLRGIGFRGGAYTDTPGIRPLTGAPATEIRTPHVPFTSGVPYPIKPWSANYFDALSGGPTRLGVTPMQFISTGPELGVRRQFDSLDFKLYYSNHIASIPSRPPGQVNTPGLSASPAISRVAGVPTGSTINFSVDVVGEPAVGLQEVWVTYTAASSSSPLHGEWQSLDLTQQVNPSHRFNGTLALPPGQNASDVRYMVQAVNGVGLVTMATNLGTYYTPAPDVVAPSDPKDETRVELLDPPRAGIYREQVTTRARFTRNGEPLANQVITFGIGAARRTALTNDQGIAQTVLTLLSVPGPTELRASFQETDRLLGSFDVSPFRIDKQNTRLTLSPTSFSGVAGGTTPFVAKLTDASRVSRVLLFQTVVFVVSGNGQTYSTASITDFQGQAQLGPVPLPAGTGYRVQAFFGGTVDVGGGQSLVLENDRYNASVSNTATLTLNADDSPPSCFISRQGTDQLGRRFVEITLRDTGAGLASITPTSNSSNVSITTSGLSAITFPQGTTAPVVIRGTRLKPSAPARFELKVTDAAVPANSLVCDPVVTTLNVGKLGTSETQTFKNISREEDTVTLRNMKGDRNVVLIYGNGRPFVVTLRDGEERSLSVASALKAGDNTLALTALGKPGSSVEVLIWDGTGASLRGRGFEPSSPDWIDALKRLRPPAN